jgi:hypothetical protein
MSTNAMMTTEVCAERRRLILALGRGHSGKTLWSRWILETMRGRGVSPIVADADSITHGLARHDESAVSPGGGVNAEGSWWRRATVNGEGLAGRPVVVDFSPDVGLIHRVDPAGLDFADRYSARGFDVTKVFFFGPDIGDAVIFSNNGAAVTATSTLLVLNEGVVGSRKADRFDPVVAHPTVRQAIETGASVVRMPELHLNRNRIGAIANFTAFAEGDGDGTKPLSAELYAVRTWLKRMDDAFAPFRNVLGLA